MRKKLKKSERGVTFSVESEAFPIGSHFRYRIDFEKKEIRIIPAESGNTVSRKKCGKQIKSLIDLRSKEVKMLLTDCDFMELEVGTEEITVLFCKENISFLQRKLYHAEEVLGAREIGSIQIPVNMLQKVSGGESLFTQMTIESYLSSLSSVMTTESVSEVRKGLTETYKVISLFSGAGLLDYPFAKDPSFDICFAVDCDAAACESYRHNIGNHIVCSDISEIHEQKLPYANVIIGGPSCKAVSN